MSRTFQDANLLQWEAYASGGEHGYAEPARIVFHCVSDRSLRARSIERQGDQADAEREIATSSEQELAELLGRASEVR